MNQCMLLKSIKTKTHHFHFASGQKAQKTAHDLSFPRVHASACGPARRYCSAQSPARSAAQRGCSLSAAQHGARHSPAPRGENSAHPSAFAVASPRPGRNLGLGRHLTLPPGLKEARADLCRPSQSTVVHSNRHSKNASRSPFPEP
jgi:hypothetical protein